jgi:hypothetical protein
MRDRTLIVVRGAMAFGKFYRLKDASKELYRFAYPVSRDKVGIRKA